MDKKNRVKLLVSLAITTVLAGLIFFSTPSKTYRILELKALDMRFALQSSVQGDRDAQSPILHIDIDDQSLARVGRWPWPRSSHALLTDILSECGARQILWDVIFTEEQKDNPQDDALFADAIGRSGRTYLPFYFVERSQPVDARIKALLRKDIAVTPDTVAKELGEPLPVVVERLGQQKRIFLDEVTAAAVQADPALTLEGLFARMEAEYGWFLFPEDEQYIADGFDRQKLLSFFTGRFAVRYPFDRWPFGKAYASLNAPAMAYAQKALGSGFINAEPDIDGVTRKVPLLVRYEGVVLPQLTVAALIDYLDVKGIRADPGRITLKGALYAGARKDIVIPVDPQGSALVNWQGVWGASFKHIPYYVILQLAEVRQQLRLQSGSPDMAAQYLKKREEALVRKLTGMVKGRICIIGLTATGTHDLRPVPLQENYPMVGTHANLIETVLTGRFIIHQNKLLLALIFILAALVIVLSSLLKLWKSLLVALGYLLGYFLVSLFVFMRFGLWLDLVGPAGIVIFGFAGITSFRFFTEEKEKLWIKQAFSHYLSKEVINELMDDPSRLKLGGERRMITVFFSDVRGFTAFSESRQPEEVVAMLNEILSAQVKVVFKYNGTLDKFVGDELMAFFGAPGDQHRQTHALVAVRTAWEIQQRMNQLRQTWAQENKAAIQIGIGINSGEMVVGNMGSSERMDYTVIGDNVNLAARLCSAASKDEIIISESTYAMVADHVSVEKLEPVMVKGKSKPVSIYRVVGLKEVEGEAGEHGHRPA